MQETGKIILIPTSGLANRLRIIASTIKLGKESGKNIIVYWDRNDCLCADFYELFEDISSISIMKIPLKYKVWIKMTQYSSRLGGFDKWYLRLFNFDFIFLDSMAKQVWHNKMNLPEEVKKAQKILICSGQEINYFELDDYKLFVPKNSLGKRIEDIARKFAVHTIGIHIRGTDNKESNRYSPLAVFIKKMKDEIGANSIVTFFVATDEEGYQEILLKEFGSKRIFFQDKVFGRNIIEGINGAVIDLFCLSRTSKIYGSYFSSYSQIAARIGNVPLEILKEDEN